MRDNDSLILEGLYSSILLKESSDEELFRAGSDPNERYDGSIPKIDWEKEDMYGSVWNEDTVKDFAKSNHNIIYPSILDSSDLNPKVVELSNASEIKKMSEQELKEKYPHEYENAIEDLKAEFEEENIIDDEMEFEPDLYSIRRKIAYDVEQSWESQKYEFSRPFGSGYPPAVVKRISKNEFEILDGNHRIDVWQEIGFDGIPTWVVDDYIFNASKE